MNYEGIPEALSDKHGGVSVVRPTLNSMIASPIKVGDYIAFGMVPVLNSGIGDFDAHFRKECSALLYRFGERVDMTGLENVRTLSNKRVYDLVSRSEARRRLAPVVEQLLHG